MNNEKYYDHISKENDKYKFDFFFTTVITMIIIIIIQQHNYNIEMLVLNNINLFSNEKQIMNYVA